MTSSYPGGGQALADRRAGALAAAGAAILFGSAYVATGFALHSFGPLAIAFWRGVAASILMAVVLRSGRAGAGGSFRSLDHGRIVRVAALGIIGGPVFIVAMNLAVGGAGATIASFVAGLYAVLAAIFAPVVLHEHLGRGAIGGFVLALAGTALLAELNVGSASAGGVAAGLVAAAAFAVYLLLSRRWMRALGLSGPLIAAANFGASVVLLGPVILILRPDLLVPPTIAPEAVVALAWLVVGPGVAAQLLIVRSVRLIPARTSSAALLLNPIAATILAAVLLGERLAAVQVAGAVLVLAGIALATNLAQRLRGDPVQARIPDPA